MQTMLKNIAGAALLALGATGAHAALYDQPVASNAYITMNGIDWAWAVPLASGVDLSYQAQFGWRLPTAQELTMAPTGPDFQFTGANVPLGGSDAVSGALFQYTDASLTGAAACAAPYFSSYRHCDWGNAPGTLNDPQPWAGQPGAVSYSESLVVRGSAPPPVPLPGAALLLTGALGALAGLRRRRRA